MIKLIWVRWRRGCACLQRSRRSPSGSCARSATNGVENIGGEYFQEVTEQVGNGLTTPRNGRGLALINWPNGESQMVSTRELDSQLVIVESLQSDKPTTVLKNAP